MPRVLFIFYIRFLFKGEKFPKRMVVRAREIDPLFRFPSLDNIIHNIIKRNLCDFFLVAFVRRSSHGVAYSFCGLVQRMGPG